MLQRCIDHATPPQKTRLAAGVAAHALALAQDPFGNYVIQYVLELGVGGAAGAVGTALAGRWPELAQQKFASNVF